MSDPDLDLMAGLMAAQADDTADAEIRKALSGPARAAVRDELEETIKDLKAGSMPSLLTLEDVLQALDDLVAREAELLDLLERRVSFDGSRGLYDSSMHVQTGREIERVLAATGRHPKGCDSDLDFI